jgi:hypothetical protein
LRKGGCLSAALRKGGGPFRELGAVRGVACILSTPPMQHPTTLPVAQRQHLAQAVRRHGVAAVSRALGLGRESVSKLAGGLAVLPGTVALAQQSLPRLDAALAPSDDLPGAA